MAAFGVFFFSLFLGVCLVLSGLLQKEKNIALGGFFFGVLVFSVFGHKRKREKELHWVLFGVKVF